MPRNSEPRSRKSRRRIGPVLATVCATGLLVMAQTTLALTPSEVAALADMGTLRDALDMVFIDTGYYVSLETLNDLSTSPTLAYDYIDYTGGARVLFPNKGLFQAARVDLLPTWNGPYVNFQPGTTQLGLTPYDQGTPLDPWGNPYYFFSPLGLIRGDSGTVTNELYGDQFDRYAIVSLGQDGTMSGDDLIITFGTGVSGLSLSSINGSDVAKSAPPSPTVYTVLHDKTITLKGYFFGASQGGSKVWFGSTELTPVGSWSDTSITLQLGPTIFGTALVKVQVGAAQSNGLQLTVIPNAVGHWEDYE